MLKIDKAYKGKNKYDEDEYYMTQAPNLIGSKKDNYLLVYAGVSLYSGSCLYFYDLSNHKTFARIEGAELLVDCYCKDSNELKKG